MDPASGRTAIPRGDHLPALDGLRGIAVLLVLWAHLPRDIAGPWIARLEYVVRPGYLGVDVFFVLSGFLITRILLGERERADCGGTREGRFGAPARFWIRRSLRIFPIYYLGLGAVSLWYRGVDVGWSAVYLQNFWYAWHADLHGPLKHTWSLAVEEHFYLVWPFVVLWLPVPRSRAIVQYGLLPLSVFAAIATVLVLEPTIATELVYRGTPYRVGSLALGAIFAYHEGWIRTHPGRALGVAAALLAVALLVVPLGRFGFAGWHPLSKMVGFAALSGAIVLAAVVAPTRLRKLHTVLAHASLRGIGRISYGIYLYHFPIYVALGLRFPAPGTDPTLATAAVGIAATLVLAWLSFHAIERPLLRFKDRFAAPRVATLPPGPGRGDPSRSGRTATAPRTA